jgi:hypothetical protein
MPHCINCGKPRDEHTIVKDAADAAEVPICPTSVYVEADDLVGDAPQDDPRDDAAAL